MDLDLMLLAFHTCSLEVSLPVCLYDGQCQMNIPQAQLRQVLLMGPGKGFMGMYKVDEPSTELKAIQVLRSIRQLPAAHGCQVR